MSCPATIQLAIPQPCAESWAAMTPATSGRHCAACTKTVVNFTQKSDADLLAYFRQASQASVCGRFRASQLGRPLTLSGAMLPARRWQAWLASLLTAALAVQGCRLATTEPVPVDTSATRSSPADSAAIEAIPYPTPISGRVVDEYTQQPVAGVVVHLKNTAATVVTDSQGLFAFSASATLVQATHSNPFVLQLQASGYPPCETILDHFRPPPNNKLQVVGAWLPIPTELMGDVDTLLEP